MLHILAAKLLLWGQLVLVKIFWSKIRLTKLFWPYLRIICMIWWPYFKTCALYKRTTFDVLKSVGIAQSSAMFNNLHEPCIGLQVLFVICNDTWSLSFWNVLRIFACVVSMCGWQRCTCAVISLICKCFTLFCCCFVLSK